MTLQIFKISKEERDFWDQSVRDFPLAHPLNAYGWGQVRTIDGWDPFYFVAKEGEVVKGMIMVLVKKIPGTGHSIMYAPKGPICDPDDRQTLKFLFQRIQEEGKMVRAIFLRIDPNISEDRYDKTNDPFKDEGFIHLDHRWSFWNSPRDVYRINLDSAATEEELFLSIDRDARRCVRKAFKEGVTIRPAKSLDELREFYQIFREFSVGKGFMCRQYYYQKALWDNYITKGNGRLFLAIYQGKIIGGLICVLFGKGCLAMHMGTPHKYSKLQTYYAYVWESIRWAKEQGCSWYSFRGVGTTPSQERFKRKFGPKVVPLVGYYDFPYRSFLYRLFLLCEFKVLPKVWRSLMTFRSMYSHIRTLFKRNIISRQAD